MSVPRITADDILHLVNHNGFANFVDGVTVGVSRQESLDRGLELACECGYLDLVQYLGQLGAQIRGNPEPLRAAAYWNRLEVAKYLVANGADLDGHSRECGQTALMDAAGSASLDVFRFLLEAGADRQARCDEGKTALDWARMGRHTAALPEMESHPDVLADYDSIIRELTVAQV